MFCLCRRKLRACNEKRKLAHAHAGGQRTTVESGLFFLMMITYHYSYYFSALSEINTDEHYRAAHEQPRREMFGKKENP